MNFLQAFFGRETDSKALTITHDHARDSDGFIRLPQAGELDRHTGSLQTIMHDNELVYACLSIKAQAARDPRLVVERRKNQASGDYTPLPDHPLRRLMASPNAKMTEGDLIVSALISWDTTSPRRFFAEKEYRRGLLVGLHPLNPACMEPRYSTTTRALIGYRWRDGGDAIDYSLDDLLIRAAPAWYAPAPLIAALGSIDADSSQTQYIRSFLTNGGMPSVYLKDTQRTLNTQQRDEIRQRWRATYRNQSQRHDIGVLDMFQDVIKLGSGINELDNDTLRQVAESRICMVLGVPPLIVYAYVGLMRSTYSNLKEAWSGFWDATMSPSLREWRDFWSHSLLPEFEEVRDIQSERIRLRYDLSQVAALQDDVDAVQTRATKAYTSGLITRNEGRTAVGYAPDPDGDTYYVRGGMRDDTPATDP